MEKKIYHEIASLENKHWWYVGRRKIVEKILSGLTVCNNPEILEIGCGTGGNFKLLSSYGNLYAMEMDSLGIAIANHLGIIKVRYGFLPDLMPFEPKKFDCIIMMDVLEHIKDDVNSIKTVYKSLKQDGFLVMTVPAFQFLWSFHDELACHQRRYTRPDLCKIVKNAGFTIPWSTYYNFFLFPLILLIRRLKRNFHTDRSDNTMPSLLINKLLTAVFSSERFFFPGYALPFGVSILVVAQKKTGSDSKLTNKRVE